MNNEVITKLINISQSFSVSKISAYTNMYLGEKLITYKYTFLKIKDLLARLDIIGSCKPYRFQFSC